MNKLEFVLKNVELRKEGRSKEVEPVSVVKHSKKKVLKAIRACKDKNVVKELSKITYLERVCSFGYLILLCRYLDMSFKVRGGSLFLASTGLIGIYYIKRVFSAVKVNTFTQLAVSNTSSKDKLIEFNKQSLSKYWKEPMAYH